jgi:hypothetical protein
VTGHLLYKKVYMTYIQLKFLWVCRERGNRLKVTVNRVVGRKYHLKRVEVRSG